MFTPTRAFDQTLAARLPRADCKAHAPPGVEAERAGLQWSRSWPKARPLQTPAAFCVHVAVVENVRRTGIQLARVWQRISCIL